MQNQTVFELQLQITEFSLLGEDGVEVSPTAKNLLIPLMMMYLQRPLLNTSAKTCDVACVTKLS